MKNDSDGVLWNCIGVRVSSSVIPVTNHTKSSSLRYYGALSMKFKGNVAAPTISLVIDVNCFAIVFLLLRKAPLSFFIWAACGSSFTYNIPRYTYASRFLDVPNDLRISFNRFCWSVDSDIIVFYCNDRQDVKY